MADDEQIPSTSGAAGSSSACLPTSSITTMEACSSSDDVASKLTTGSPDKDVVSEAVQSFQHGKRHMIVSDYYSAVPCFEKACQLLDSCYGVNAPECAEAYLNYGIALYELSRMEDGMFHGVVNVEGQVEGEEDDEEEQDEEEDEGENGEENGDNNEAKQAETSEDKETNEASAAVTEASSVNVEEKFDIDINQPSTSRGVTSQATGNGNKSDDEEDNVTNSEIAFEVLTNARNYFSQHLDNREHRLNLAEALQKLGEISMDWENADGAIELLDECLSHRKDVLEPDDRLIAHTYHFLGLAFSLKSDFDNSNQCFNQALEVVQLRLENLKAKDINLMEGFEKMRHEKEIEQLEGLIPEIQAKIEDMKEQILSQYNAMKSLVKEKESEDEQDKKLESNKDKPINNISHLIKRKRENETNEAESAKKVCPEVNSSSGEGSSTNGTSANGNGTTQVQPDQSE